MLRGKIRGKGWIFIIHFFKIHFAENPVICEFACPSLHCPESSEWQSCAPGFTNLICILLLQHLRQ